MDALAWPHPLLQSQLPACSLPAADLHFSHSAAGPGTPGSLERFQSLVLHNDSLIHCKLFMPALLQALVRMDAVGEAFERLDAAIAEERFEGAQAACWPGL